MRKELDDRLFKLATRSKRYLADKDYEHYEFKQFFNTINTTANRVPQELSWDNAKAMVNLAFKNIFHHLNNELEYRPLSPQVLSNFWTACERLPVNKK